MSDNRHRLINIQKIIAGQLQYTLRTLSLIASENYVSESILGVLGSILTNKYAEGTYEKRYYSGCRYVDEVEYAAIENAKHLFGVKYANVQPYSGSIANLSVYLSLLNEGDTILSMSLDSGGHISHGLKRNFSGRFYNIVHYGVNKLDLCLDYDQVERIALKCKPKLIIVGCSAYSRVIDFKRFGKIAKKVNAYLMADIAHIAGIIAVGKHMSPVGYADVITTTTHKTLRGPRGGMVMTDNKEIFDKVTRTIFPGLQGGPLMHVIAAKALCFEEAMQDEFKVYISKVLENTKNLVFELNKLGCTVLTGGSDNHMFLIDTIKNFNLTGQEAQDYLESIGVLCNKNMLPFDHLEPHVTSGIRIGLSSTTTRGIYDMATLAKIIVGVLKNRGDKDLSITRSFTALLLTGNNLYKNL